MLTLISILENLLVMIPILLAVAFSTLAERKTMGVMQRRIGPNVVGMWGFFQPFADALKLLLKEYILPTQATPKLFFWSPNIMLTFSLLGYGIVPFAAGYTIGDLDLGLLFTLAVSSLSTFGILLAGWSANSKYAFLGSLRSTAQLISYELILSSAILLVVLVSSSLNLTTNVESQKAIYFLYPLFPAFKFFFIAAIADTNRAPFDLAEAESELVAGYMTEHASVIFVFFFLAEYASILLMCIITALIFIGGYLLLVILNLTYIQSYIDGSSLGFKSCILVFVFIWVRASFPRVRFDQLMSTCWTVLLPIVIGFIILLPLVMYYFSLFDLTSFAGNEDEIRRRLEQEAEAQLNNDIRLLQEQQMEAELKKIVEDAKQQLKEQEIETDLRKIVEDGIQQLKEQMKELLSDSEVSDSEIEKIIDDSIKESEPVLERLIEEAKSSLAPRSAGDTQSSSAQESAEDTEYKPWNSVDLQNPAERLEFLRNTDPKTQLDLAFHIFRANYNEQEFTDILTRKMETGLNAGEAIFELVYDIGKVQQDPLHPSIPCGNPANPSSSSENPANPSSSSENPANPSKSSANSNNPPSEDDTSKSN